eukprot:7879756-Heterocapsa_arctica.AAC.1
MRWQRRSVELAEVERGLHAAAHAEVRPFLEGKNVLLFGEMLSEAGFPNARGVIDLILQGVPMFGEFPRTGLFREKLVEPTKSVDDLYKASKWTRRALVGSVRSSGDHEVDRELWRRTQLELQNGWLAGPFSEDQLTQLLGPLWVPARRFPAPKDARPIDDYSEFGHNATSTNYETADLDGIDSVVSLAKAWAHATSGDGSVTVELASGATLSGYLHEEWSHSAEGRSSVGKLLGRTLDLEAAFKQLARHPAGAALSVICVWDP